MMSLREFSDKYFHFLTHQLSGINLTAINSEEEFFHKQVCDSVFAYEQSAGFSEIINSTGIVVDIGFGGGFPIVPLAFVLPNIQFIGIESKKKKCLAVEQIIKHFSLTNIQLLHGRFEEFLFDREVTITSKAVTTIENLLKGLNYSVTTHVFFYKGPNLFALEEKGLNNIHNEWEIMTNNSIKVPNTEGRTLVGFKNKIVPRGTAKKLAKISGFL